MSSVLDRRLALLNSRYEDTGPLSIISAITEEEFPPGKVALVSSFGAESAVLLYMISRIHLPGGQAPATTTDA